MIEHPNKRPLLIMCRNSPTIFQFNVFEHKYSGSYVVHSAGATLLVGGICLNGIPLAMLMRDPSYLNKTNEMAPLVSHQQSEMAPIVSKQQSEMAPLISNQQSEMAPLVSYQQSEEMAPLVPNERSEMAPLTPKPQEVRTRPLESCKISECSEEQLQDTTLMNKQKYKQLTCSSISDRLGLHFLKNWMFVMFMISYSTTLLCHMSLHWFIPDRAVEIGFSTHDAAMSVTVVNFANIFSRGLLGLAISDKFVNQIMILTSYVFVSGVTTVLAIFCTSYWSYMIFSALFGILRGLFLMLSLLISVHLVGKSQVDLALGLIFSLAGLVYLVAIPLFGHFNEVTHSYRTTFILYGSIELLGGLFLVTIPVYLCVKRLKY